MNTTINAGTELLRESLVECQATVRTYDTKAQIVGVGYIFAINLAFKFDSILPQETSIHYVEFILAWIIIITPVLLFAFVLHPSRKIEPALENQTLETLQRILYVHPEKYQSVQQLVEAARSSDMEQELAYELLKMSKLRELKRKRFLRALFSAGLCFVLLFITQASQALFG